MAQTDDVPYDFVVVFVSSVVADTDLSLPDLAALLNPGVGVVLILSRCTAVRTRHAGLGDAQTVLCQWGARQPLLRSRGECDWRLVMHLGKTRRFFLEY